jgi:hypothetical protein
VIDVGRQRHPVAPSLERVFWYQHLFQTERGRECLTEHRRELCRMLWSEWSPGCSDLRTRIASVLMFGADL